MKVVVTGLLSVGLVTAILWQRSALADLRARQKDLTPALAELARLKQENGELEKLRARLPEVDQLREATRELPALRNQARQLREATAELERLVTNCEQLKAQLQSPVPRSISEMPGFVAKESWRRAGLSTPQAAIETFFWAVRQGSLEDLQSCMPPDEGPLDPRDAQSLRQILSQVKGYRVVGTKQETADLILISIQVAAGGEVKAFPVRRFGQEWKIEGL